MKDENAQPQNTEVKNPEAEKQQTEKPEKKNTKPPAPLEYRLWTDGQGFYKQGKLGTTEPFSYTMNVEESQKWDNLAKIRRMVDALGEIYGVTNFRIIKVLAE